eukprot:3320009-Pyramimonas_sp.AAC.1
MGAACFQMGVDGLMAALGFKRFFPSQARPTDSIFQAEDVRRELRDGYVAHSFRLDRIYSSLPAALIADLTIQSSVIGKLCFSRSSGHIPVLVLITTHRPSSSDPP